MELLVHRVGFFNPQPQAIRCLSYDKTNSRLAVSRSDSSIELWDLKENPYLEKSTPGSSAISIETLAWCDGRLFSSGLYGKITEHDLNSLLPKYQIVVTSGCPIWCMNANSSKCLAIGNEDGHVVLHMLSSEGLDYEKKFDKQEGSIICLDWHVDEQIIVTGSTDAIRVWNVNTGHVVNRILLARSSKNTPTVVWCIAVTRDMTIISGDSCGKTSFWDGNTGTLMTSAGFNEDILALSVNEEEDVVYTSGINPSINVYVKSKPISNWIKSLKRTVHTHDVRALQIAGKFLASGGDDCNLVFTKYPPKTTITFFPFCQKSHAMAISEPPCVLLQYADGVEIWNLVKSMKLKENSFPVNILRVRPKKNENIICSALSPNGKWLAHSTQLQVRLFSIKMDTSSGACPVIDKINLPKEDQTASSLLLFTSEPTNLILYRKSKISIIKCDSMQPTLEAVIEEDSDSAGETHLMDLSSDNTYLACGSHNGNIIIYNLKTLKVFCKLPLYKCQPTSLKFDPTAENLLAVYTDRKVIEYNLKALAYSSWSKQQALLELQQASFHPIISICFVLNKLLLQDETTLYVFDRTEEHQVKRIKRTEDTYDTVTEGGFKTIDRYQHISSIHACKDDLVVVNLSSDWLLDILPPPLYKKKYGT